MVGARVAIMINATEKGEEFIVSFLFGARGCEGSSRALLNIASLPLALRNSARSLFRHA